MHKCEAQLKILIPKNDDRMRYPSDEYKQLAWGGYPQDNDLEPSKDIHAHGTKLLHIVFSDSDFGTTPVEAPRRFACVSTRERLAMEVTREEDRAPNLTVQDSFSDGL